MNYRNLTAEEIQILEHQNNSAENWDTVLVKKNFEPSQILGNQFFGEVKLGIFNQPEKTDTGMVQPKGIRNSTIQDCIIDDDVYIANVMTLFNYHIQSNVRIESVGELSVTGSTTFGNGVGVKVINEGGGREILIYDKLTSQIAYFQALYRHDVEFIKTLTAFIKKYVSTKKASRGTIETNCTIKQCTNIKNVNFGAYAYVCGASHLEDGTVVSNADEPVYIGNGVIAKHFIILSGAQVKDASLIDTCFIGQCVTIEKQYSAEHSCFFANSVAGHGEAVSLFAGPYSVTHHKSTLLIAMYTSFLNAGSGTNQSNHMYKLGPIHQGVLERGIKTGSFSYMLWPCRVGAFSVVIGKHYSNFDSSEFPFSYLLEANGKTSIIPGLNLCTIGNKRDKAKWPARDKRKNPLEYDLIHYDILSPYTLEKAIQGFKKLSRFDKQEIDNAVQYKGLLIKRNKFRFGCEQYELACKVFVYEKLMSKLPECPESASFAELLDTLYIDEPDAHGVWIDACGMLAPKDAVDNIIQSIKDGHISSLNEFQDALLALYNKYEEFVWAWCSNYLEQHLGIKIHKISKTQFLQLIKEWEEISIRFNKNVIRDAEKEMSNKSRIGYGIDEEKKQNADFLNVVDKKDVNDFLKTISEEPEEIHEKAQKIIAKIKNCK